MAHPDDRDPRHHTQTMKARLQETIDHLHHQDHMDEGFAGLVTYV